MVDAGGGADLSCMELQRCCQVIPGRQVLCRVMPILVGAAHDISSRDFKLCWLVVLGGIVLQCIGGDLDVLWS
jgi:hypothetical protein